MAIRKRGDRWYIDFRFNDPVTGQTRRFKRSTGPGTTKREAVELERAWRQEVEQPPEAQVHSAAFSGFAHHWLETHIRVNRKPSYFRSTEQSLRCHIVPFFGDADLRHVGPETIARYKAAKVKVLANKTVNNHLGVISVMFNHAIDWGYADTNPVKKTGLLQVVPQEMKFWDKDQSDAFLEAVQQTSPDLYAFFLAALRTGCRIGELFALRWDDVDFVKSQLHVVQNYTHGQTVSPKSNRARVIPMSDRLAEVLKAHRHLRGPLVFCQDSGAHLNRDRVKHPFWRAIRKAGLRTIRLHDLRHSFASQLVMAGVPLTAVKELLGHATLEMTMRYAHLSPDAKHAYVGRLDAIETGTAVAGGSDPTGRPSWSQNGPKLAIPAKEWS